MSIGIKIIVSGLEGSGKTLLTSKIENALLINCDFKSYHGKTPNITLNEFNGMQEFTSKISKAIQKYKEKFGKFPKVIIFDTITHLYMKVIKYNGKKYKGFEIHNANTNDVLALNSYLQDVLIKNGIDVVLCAHVMEKMGTISVAGQGEFKNHGSWISTINEALYIDSSDGAYKVYIKSPSNPARSLVYGEDVTELVKPIKEFDINEYLNGIREFQSNNNDNVLEVD